MHLSVRHLARLTVIYLSFTALFPAQPKKEQPVGLVIAANAAQLRRAGAELPFNANPGDVLFSGDALITGADGSASFLYCPEKSSEDLASNAEIILGTQQIQAKKGGVTNKKPVTHCLLPQLERSPDAGQLFYPAMKRELKPETEPPDFKARVQALPDDQRKALLAELDPVEKALSQNPKDQPARIARAVLLQKYNLQAEAAEEYRRISSEWPKTVWTRQLVHLAPPTSPRRDTDRAKAAPKLEEGKTYALLVGISKYQRLSELEFLKYADQDAITFDQHLRSGRGGMVPDENIVLLTNEKATTAAIKNNIQQFLKTRAGQNDTVVLFIAAHGIVSDTPTDKDAYIVTYDSDPQDLKSTALPMALVQKVMEEDLPNVGRVLVFIDVCHAGNIGTIKDRKGNKVNVVVAKLLETQGQVFGLLASQPDEYSIEAKNFGGGHGAFTYFLLKALSGEADKDGDGIVNPNEVFSYVYNQVQDATFSLQHPEKKGSLSSDSSLSDLDKTGIALGAFEPLPKAVLMASRGRSISALQADRPVPKTTKVRISRDLALFDAALDAGRILPETPLSAFAPLAQLKKTLKPEEYAVEENRLRIALEDAAQQVLLRYLTGDQEPQKRSDFENGALYFQAAQQLPPDSTVLESKETFCEGRVLIFEKKYREAAELLERAARLDPQGAYSYNGLGIAYLERADYERAKLAFRDAIQRAPHWAYPWHNLALAYTETGDYDQAIRSYQEGMRLAPKYSYLAYNLGLVYQRLNRRAEAEQAYKKAIAISPNLGEPYNALGYLNASRGKFAEAERFYKEALAKNPDLLAARHNLAVLLSEKPDRLSEAIDLWRQNLAKSADYLPSHLSLAETLAAQGKTAEAIGEYEAVLKSKPDYVAARRALAGLLVKSGKPDAALEQLREALKRAPRNPELNEETGDLQKGAGRASDAAASYQTALKYAGESKARKRIRAKMSF